jgi:hypothetical protein
MYRAALILAATALLAPSGAFPQEVTDCEHSDAKTILSPDKKWIASVQEQVCAVGNRAAAAVNVDLLRAADSSHAGRVFSMRVPRSRDHWPRVIWISPTEMQLWAPNRAEIGKQLSEFEGIRIELKYCGDNPQERAQVVEYQAAFKKWMQDTTAWAERRKVDPSDPTPRPKRPVEPRYSSDSCENI